MHANLPTKMTVEMGGKCGCKVRGKRGKGGKPRRQGQDSPLIAFLVQNDDHDYDDDADDEDGPPPHFPFPISHFPGRAANQR